MSLVELLAAVAIATTAISATAGLFEASRRFMINQDLQTDATGSARAVLDSVTRDLRLAGACLPTTGDFIALAGTDNGTQDSITMRTGLVRPDMSCVLASTAAASTSGATSLTLENASGFSAGMRAYIRGASTSEYFDVSSVNTSSNVLGCSALSAAYAAGSGVYAIDERTYSIQQTTNRLGVSIPELMLKIADQTAEPFAYGISTLNFQYQLDQNCPPCDTVSLPADLTTWRLVQEVLVTVTAQSETPVLAQGATQYYTRTLTAGIKPRNLLPQG